MAETYCDNLNCNITEYKYGGFDIAKFWGKGISTGYEIYLPHGGVRIHCCDTFSEVKEYVKNHKEEKR